ncbi:DUF222 domain-containing protein [Microbacterium maritypicum]|uniref:DUF222 domain-containing protein n=1 Tax=Microbacterium maritypicum TaxID=33918 RepID=UPI00296E85AC|nr:DUF222 domain-containing protein [Microbacterium liquefaciens]
MALSTDLDLDLEERRRVLDAWVDTRRRIAALEAEAADLLTEQIAIHDADVSASPFHREAIHRSMIAEFSAAGHVSKGSMEFAFADAHTLHTHLPAVRAAFADGMISVGHVREIARACALVAEAIRNRKADPAVMELFETAALVVAERDTAARTRAHARQVAAALVGETLVERHRRAAEERCVTVRALDDGLALLTAVLPEWIATAISDRLNRMTREVVRARDTREILPQPWWFDDEVDHPDEPPLDDPSVDFVDGGVIHGADGDTFATDPEVTHFPADTRTWKQTEADLFSDLLLTAEPSTTHGDALDGIQARIQVTVAATTLTGVDDRPAELDGLGPLSPDIVRELAGRNTGWTRLFLDPTGMVVETDTYTPTEGCDGSCARVTDTAASRGAACRRTAARSTTTTIMRREGRPGSTTSATSAGATTRSSIRTFPIRIAGPLSRKRTAASRGTVRWAATMPTRRPGA